MRNATGISLIVCVERSPVEAAASARGHDKLDWPSGLDGIRRLVARPGDGHPSNSVRVDGNIPEDTYSEESCWSR